LLEKAHFERSCPDQLSDEEVLISPAGIILIRKVLRIAPNILTSLRLVLALLFPFLPPAWWLPVLIIGGLTEFFDGFLARRFGSTSKFGQILDPIADKMFVLFVAITFLFANKISLAELLLVAFRDLAVIALVTIASISRRKIDVQLLKPNIWGKVATTAQFGLLLSLAYYKEMHPEILVPTIALSLIAGAAYSHRFFLITRSA
jgi:phosphatidylglycerophosphate synthase